MTELNTLLHKSAFDSLDFDVDYYYFLSKGKRTLELCAGFGRVCNKLFERDVDISAIELDPFNFAQIKLPNHKKINNNIFDCFELGKQFDVILAPFNSFAIFNAEKDISNFFTLLAKLLNDDGLISLSYYHPSGWRVIPEDETYINVHGMEYIYTSNYDLSNRISKVGMWHDIFKRKDNGQIVSSTKYELRIYESIEDVNIKCSSSGLKCINMISDFYQESHYEPGWKEFILIKK